jgi:hypothetical protein
LKHQNISAVLIEMGVPYIDGYKPRFNYQRSLLPGAVTDYLLHHPDLQAVFHADAEASVPMPSVEDILAALEAPPKRDDTGAAVVGETVAIYNPMGVNYLEREARNQSLGDAGELFVIEFERARLIHAGKESLAGRIERVSVTQGPAAGFDIHSYEENGTDRFIEAKTTKYGKGTPFFVTPNELAYSRSQAKRYYLYRVFRFRAEPRVFALHGYLQEQCALSPSQFLARVV